MYFNTIYSAFANILEFEEEMEKKNTIKTTLNANSTQNTWQKIYVVCEVRAVFRRDTRIVGYCYLFGVDLWLYWWQSLLTFVVVVRGKWSHVCVFGHVGLVSNEADVTN